MSRPADLNASIAIFRISASEELLRTFNPSSIRLSLRWYWFVSSNDRIMCSMTMLCTFLSASSLCTWISRSWILDSCSASFRFCDVILDSCSTSFRFCDVMMVSLWDNSMSSSSWISTWICALPKTILDYLCYTLGTCELLWKARVLYILVVTLKPQT